MMFTRVNFLLPPSALSRPSCLLVCLAVHKSDCLCKRGKGHSCPFDHVMLPYHLIHEMQSG